MTIVVVSAGAFAYWSPMQISRYVGELIQSRIFSSEVEHALSVTHGC
jgi:hypothetical protein